MSEPEDFRNELARVRRVSDMLCSAHSGLRDRFQRRALLLDLLRLGIALWLVALVFVAPQIKIQLTPFDLNERIWFGLLGVATFMLTLIELKVKWKERANAHKRTATLYAEVKREAGYVLAATAFDESAGRRVLTQYDFAGAIGEAIPEADFLPQKGRHLRKVALSKHLDSHPSASLVLVRLKLWWRGNITGGTRDDS